MTSDAASSPPRKRAWKRLIVALACVVAVVTIVFLATPPKPEPVKVWFVGATNEMGTNRLVFEGTNGIPRQIVFSACVTTSATHQAKSQTARDPRYDMTLAFPAAGTNFTFTLDAPPKDIPYFVQWGFHDIAFAETRLRRFRFGCYDFFSDHGMPALARPFAPATETHYIPSTEIKE